ncbi:hypothetical protein HPB48_001989 [Haemaphysalis longicornis]|uniref:Uncharacterized protein n=1 Tax=Haemaphysalis longicornis TaxID=44386 RepID=A0A9J6GAH9_HAELO|nr:hypothetical protein HPB48_001989 [Haemaphysalis longicornis]
MRCIVDARARTLPYSRSVCLSLAQHADMANRGFCLPGLGHRLSILTLGFTVGLALGLLWASPARSWNSVYPAAPTVIRRGLTHLQRQLSAIKNNSALASALKRPLVMAKLQAGVCLASRVF